ncbi:MAG: sensor histidine kinase [Saprospiraceae bacterium]|nr:sensor histidine kinase [Saprospiraceae bacterium]
MDTGFQGEEIVLMITAGVLIMLLLAVALIAFFLLSQRKLNDERQKAQARQLELSEQLLYSTLTTQENERRRIAKELHDAVGSKLNVLRLNLHRLKKQAPASNDVAETVGELFGVIDTTIDTTRRIAHDLLPPTIENFGLAEALAEICDHYRHSGALHLEFQVKENTGAQLDKTAELNLFRVVQELLANSVKHGPPTQIYLYLWLMPTSLRLEYSDNGPGFDLSAAHYKPGLGMQNIQSRLRMIGAELHFESAPGAGVRARIKYPYPT